MPRCRVEHLGLVASPVPLPWFDPPPSRWACVALSAADLNARLELYAGRAKRMEPLFGGRKATAGFNPTVRAPEPSPIPGRAIDPDPPAWTATEDDIVRRGYAAGMKYSAIARKLARLGWPSRANDSVRHRAVRVLGLARRRRAGGRTRP